MTGCLLLHGFGGSPFEMEALAERLRASGHPVSLPCLPGHDQDIESFSRTGFSDWLEAADSSLASLDAQCSRVVVMGLSMGGTLALALAQRRPVAGVVCVAAPVYIYRLHPWQVQDWRLVFLPLIAPFVKRIKRAASRPEAREIAPWRGYEGYHLPPQLLSLKRGADAVRARLADVTCPLLIIQDKGDRTVHPDNAWEIASGVSSQDVVIIRTAIRETVAGKHLLTTHRETKTLVTDACVRFAATLSGTCQGA